MIPISELKGFNMERILVQFQNGYKTTGYYKDCLIQLDGETECRKPSEFTGFMLLSGIWKLNENNELYDKVLDKFGKYTQIDKAQEEAIELALACSRVKSRDCSLDNLIEEIADVEIMIEQLKRMFSLTQKVSIEKEYKINRLKNRLDGDNSK